MKQEIIVHRSAKAFLPQTAFGCILLEQIQGNGAQHPHVFRAFTGTDARVILAERDIQHPVKTVFNRPVMLCGVQDGGGICFQAADVAGGVVSDLVALAPLTLDPDDAVEVRPTIVVADVVKGCWVAHHPTGANFNAPAGFMGRAVRIHLHLSKALLIPIAKLLSNILFEMALVVFDPQQIEAIKHPLDSSIGGK